MPDQMDEIRELAAKAYRMAKSARAFAIVALVASILALLVQRCEPPKPKPTEPGPSVKVVRIKNSSGQGILGGVKVKAAPQPDGQPTSAHMPIWQFADPIPNDNDPGNLGDLLPPYMPSPPAPPLTLDPGYKKLIYGLPPPYSKSWVYDVELEDGTHFVNAVCTQPTSPDGVHIVEVLAVVEAQGSGGSLEYRIRFEISYWRHENGVWFEEPWEASATDWLPAGTTGSG